MAKKKDNAPPVERFDAAGAGHPDVDMVDEPPPAMEIIDSTLDEGDPPAAFDQHAPSAIQVAEPTLPIGVMPVLSLEAMAERRRMLLGYMKQQMIPEVDYGIIPGCKKPSLYQPGADKLRDYFGLAVDVVPVRFIENFDLKAPLFHYVHKCVVTDRKTGTFLASAEGSCNSLEDKYRWRDAHRVCPHCKQEAIIKGKEEWGGGWLCFTKKGGCNAKFREDDPAIVGQKIGRVPNEDIFTQVNTISAMAQKRATIRGVRMAVSATEIFTQDVEDFPPGTLGQAAPPVNGQPPTQTRPPREQATKQNPPKQEPRKEAPPKSWTPDQLAVRQDVQRTIIEKLEYLKGLNEPRPQPPASMKGAAPKTLADSQIPTDDLQAYDITLHESLMACAKGIAEELADDDLYQLVGTGSPRQVYELAAKLVKERA